MNHPYFFRFMMEIFHGFLRRRPSMIEIARRCIIMYSSCESIAIPCGCQRCNDPATFAWNPSSARYQDMESKGRAGLLKFLFLIQANMMQDPVHFSKYIVNEWSHHILYIVHNYFSESPGPANASTSSNINDIFEETERDRERKTNSGAFDKTPYLLYRFLMRETLSGVITKLNARNSINRSLIHGALFDLLFGVWLSLLSCVIHEGGSLFNSSAVILF